MTEEISYRQHWNNFVPLRSPRLKDHTYTDERHYFIHSKSDVPLYSNDSPKDSGDIVFTRMGAIPPRICSIQGDEEKKKSLTTKVIKTNINVVLFDIRGSR